MYKFSFSVRTHCIGQRYGYNLTTAAGCIAAANDLMTHSCNGVNKRTITELFRAGGLGVYQIAAKINKDSESVKNICERFDQVLHESVG